MKPSKRLKRLRKPTARMVSVAGQAPKKADATTDSTVSERPLNDFLAEVSERTGIRVGVPLPLGTDALDGGVNFALFSRDASRVQLELFDHPEDAKAARVIDLDPARNRTGDVWHVWIEGNSVRPAACLSRGRTVSTQGRAAFQFQQATPRSLRHGNHAVAHLGVRPSSGIRSSGPAETRFVRWSIMRRHAEVRIHAGAFPLA